MVRSPCFDKNGRKKGAWSPEEDELLRAYVRRYGHWNWRELPKFAGLSRCGKSCRLRWLNYLQPNVKRGNYSKAEEETIKKLHTQLGNKWSAIAKQLPGRTDNEIKNYWHTHLKKRERQNPAKSQVVQQLARASKPGGGDDQKRELESKSSTHADAPAQYILESFSMSPESESSPSSSEVSAFTFDYTPSMNEMNRLGSPETFAASSENFWNEPFLTEEHSYSQYYFPPINVSQYDSYCSTDTDFFPDIWSMS